MADIKYKHDLRLPHLPSDQNAGALAGWAEGRCSPFRLSADRNTPSGRSWYRGAAGPRCARRSNVS